MKLKHCPLCKKDLPKDNFTSTRAKYCDPCKRIRQLEQARNRNQRQIDKLQKKTRKVTAKKKELRISDLKKVVQRAVNKYIRERDLRLPCISCGKMKDDKDAGHYLAQGSTGVLRYDFDNINGQCVSCNRFKHGNLIEYRISLIDRIGVERVESLEAKRNDVKKWTREELHQILSDLRGKTAT